MPDTYYSGQLLGISGQDGITAAAGGGQGAATQLTAEINRITTVATAADSVKLPPSAVGLDLMVINHGANAMQVFGASGSGDTIDDIASGTGVSQMPNSCVLYFCTVPGKWYTEGLATGYEKTSGLQTLSFTDGVTAHAGGTQAAGVPITTMLFRVSTVGSAGDSVTLPVSTPGMVVTVFNGAGANSMNIFPNAGGTTTEKINALSANAAFAAAAGTVTIFYCMTAGQWFTK